MKGKAFSVMFTAPGEVSLEAAQVTNNEPGPTQVTGRTLVSLVSTGTEVAIFRGIDLPPYPFNPGYASVFEVERVGASLAETSIGDILLCLGPHRAWQAVDRAECVLVPKGLAPEVAVFARIMSIGMSALFFVQARPPQGALVLGLGLVGNLAAQVFRACGYRVRAYDPDQHRRHLAASLGIEVIADPQKELQAEAEPPALALECSGSGSGFRSACQMVRQGGEVVLIGVPRKVSGEEMASLLPEVFNRRLTIASGSEWRLPLDGGGYNGASILRNMEVALNWLLQSRVSTKGIAESVSPLEVKHVFESLAGGTGPLSFIFDWRKSS